MHLIYNYKLKHFDCAVAITVYLSGVGSKVCGVASAEVIGEQNEKQVAEGYSLTQFCDKIIDLFLNEKPRAKDWRKYLVFREEWNKYRESFYRRCQMRADEETDPTIKLKFSSLATKVRKVSYITISFCYLGVS